MTEIKKGHSFIVSSLSKTSSTPIKKSNNTLRSSAEYSIGPRAVSRGLRLYVYVRTS